MTSRTGQREIERGREREGGEGGGGWSNDMTSHLIMQKHATMPCHGDSRLMNHCAIDGLAALTDAP